MQLSKACFNIATCFCGEKILLSPAVMPKNKLFDDNDSEEDTVVIKTENEYAKRYDNWREKEELHKLEQKYGDKDLDASSSTDSEDDEEPPDMPEEMEAQFLKTLSLLKTKDPRIYDPSYKFFDEFNEEKEKKEQQIEEQDKPKKEVKSLADAFADSDDDDDDENDGQIFKVEKKAPVAPTPSKETKIKEYLSGKVDHVDPDEEKDLAPLRALWSDPKLSQGEAFLRDYILNKRYLEPDSSGPSGKLLDSTELSADNELVEEQGRFERAYNFRFEEPDQEYLKRYPRTLASIRPKDDSRSRKRAEVRTRKEEEKRRKMEEISRLKALKLKEIQEKLARIKQVTGNDELAFKDSDIEGEFDPEEHDRRMRAIFDDQYYGGADETKPEFPDLDEELEIENWENYEAEAEDNAPAQEDGPHCEDEDFNMDADYDPKRARTTLLEEIQETLGKKRRNRKRKSKLANILKTEKPVFIPDVTNKTYDEYMEEYYKMDCEDVIGGDLPTRFKYRETVPNSFGLTIEEILLADDRELNKWASFKKTVKIRPENVEKGELRAYQAKAADLQLKRKLLPSLFKDLPEEPEVVVPIEGKKKKKKKKNKSNEANSEEAKNNEIIREGDTSQENGEINQSEGSSPIKEVKKNKKNKHKQEFKNQAENSEVSDAERSTKVAEETKPEVSQSKNSLKVGKRKKNKRNKDQISQNTPNNNKVKEEVTKNKFTEEKRKTINAGANNNAINGKNNPKNNQGKMSKENSKEQNVNNRKRKLDTNAKDGPTNKKNKLNPTNKKDNKNKNANKQKGKQNKNKNAKGKEDLMSKLSDERLKAYGLNPKKYRSFLKFKKF